MCRHLSQLYQFRHIYHVCKFIEPLRHTIWIEQINHYYPPVCCRFSAVGMAPSSSS